MQKYIEVTGKSEEAAVESALKQLGLDRDEVSVEILERAKSGFLGIGSTPAKVRVTYEAEEETVEAVAPVHVEEKTPAAEEESAPVRESAPHSEEKASMPRTEDTPAPQGDEKAQRIETFLKGLLEHMGAEARPVVRLGEENTYEVELVGDHLGSLIGRRGETLDAIQQLTNYAVNRGQSHRARIHVDAEGYRAKREESLVRLANKVAAKAVKYRRSVTLEPMNAYERHVIHAALQDHPEVTTYSIGTEPNRRTVVAYGHGENQ